MADPQDEAQPAPGSTPPAAEEAGGERPADVATIALTASHMLEVARAEGRDVLRVLTPDGRAGVHITITPQGIALHVAGGDLTLRSDGALNLQAETLALHGKRGVSITSEGDARMEVTGDLTTEARIQNIRARLGNVNVTANDDVKLAGERIRLNT